MKNTETKSITVKGKITIYDSVNKLVVIDEKVVVITINSTVVKLNIEP